MEKALEYLETDHIHTVIKADGLALGKGVIIAMTREEAKDAVKSMMQDKIFGASGNNIVIEEFLTGPEVSVLAFTDGKTVAPMVSSWTTREHSITMRVSTQAVWVQSLPTPTIQKK